MNYSFAKDNLQDRISKWSLYKAFCYGLSKLAFLHPQLVRVIFDFVQLCFRPIPYRYALRYVVENGTLPVIQSLLSAGADKSIKDSNGNGLQYYLNKYIT